MFVVFDTELFGVWNIIVHFLQALSAATIKDEKPVTIVKREPEKKVCCLQVISCSETLRSSFHCFQGSDKASAKTAGANKFDILGDDE